MNSAFANFLSLLLQAGGIAAASFLLFYSYEVKFDRWIDIDYLSSPWNYALRISLTILVTCPLLSVLWSRLVQGLIFRFKYDVRHSNLGRLEGRPGLPASRRGGFLYAAVRLFTIPFIAYGYMRILNLEPDISLGFSRWSNLDIAVLVVQILSSFLTFALSLIALWATVQRWAFTLPLLLSTPAAVGWYWLSQVEAVDMFPFYKNTPYFFDFSKNFDGLVLAVLAALWVGQLLALGAYIWKKPHYPLAREQSLFLSPYYDPMFVDSFLLLNRLSVQSMYWHPISNIKSHSGSSHGKQPAVFICSTMYREAEHEMRQMLTSINRVAEAISEGRTNTSVKKKKEPPHYESHIFFDGATSGNKFNEFVLQLISLLEETLGLDLSDIEKTQTPYGYQLRWMVKDVLPIFVHLKDNNKVKNKKRWSQVMYMNYIIDHRLQERDGEGREKFDPHTTYILTTDADIDFQAESVAALLDFLYRDDSVGAVCARTHPLGSGPMVWYQIFEYAFGHWFQKSAEHVLGCVLCCPGCFSVFRVSAIADVLDTYQSNVTTASEFLTKDMGEDRWLCTLLIEKGWRLEYAALSENKTFCPDNFNEFFNQRRRWVPSTVANLMELMANAKKIAFNNDSISLLFILYQLIIIFSTAITPGTVILVVSSGLQSAYGWNTYAIIGILGGISILYGIICLIFPEKIQLNVGKALTIGFAIIMAISFTGIVTQTISFLELQTFGNVTSGEVAGAITIDSVYLWGFSLIVIIAGFLHIRELISLLHFVWYIMGLPSAYLLLMIYSAANLNNRSWGTRVGISARQTTNDEGIFNKLKLAATVVWSAILTKSKGIVSRKKDTEEEAPRSNDEEAKLSLNTRIKHTGPPPPVPLKITHPPMQEDVKQWLSRLQCEEYINNFETHGYTRFEFIWGMKIEDLQDIGIIKRGHLLRLNKAIRKQVPPLFQSGLPGDVAEFLESLELTQYLPVFKSEGYYLPDDVENLIGLTREDLLAMGITKSAHLRVISGGISRLRNPTGREVKIHNTKAVVEKAPTFQLGRTDIAEDRFWTTMTEGVLKPELSVPNNDTDELKEKLTGLRNNTLLAMLVLNVLWLALLLSFNLQYLERFGIVQSALPALFAILYFGIIAIQFICLIVHRIETMVHVLART